jgi:hypothetical protein
MNQLVGRLGRLSLVVMLGALSAYLTVRPELGDEDTFERSGPITRVAQHGRAEVEDVEWTLKSLRVYTRLVNEDKEEIDLKKPEGSVIVVAIVGGKTTERTKIDDGFNCEMNLADDRGNVWEESDDTYGFALPTFCGDDKIRAVKRGGPFTVGKIFVVPPDAVPHLTGLLIPPKDVTSAEDRVLLTP